MPLPLVSSTSRSVSCFTRSKHVNRNRGWASRFTHGPRPGQRSGAISCRLPMNDHACSTSLTRTNDRRAAEKIRVKDACGRRPPFPALERADVSLQRPIAARVPLQELLRPIRKFGQHRANVGYVGVFPLDGGEQLGGCTAHQVWYRDQILLEERFYTVRRRSRTNLA